MQCILSVLPTTNTITKSYEALTMNVKKCQSRLYSITQAPFRILIRKWSQPSKEVLTSGMIFQSRIKYSKVIYYYIIKKKKSLVYGILKFQ